MSEETTNPENTGTPEPAPAAPQSSATPEAAAAAAPAADAGGEDKMPTFLKVLCILSFIGCGIGLVSGIMGYFSNKTLAAAGGGFADMMEGMEDLEGAEGMSEAMELMGGMVDFNAMANSALIQALLCVVIFIGVLMMWKRKKTGFYIYTVSNLAYGLVPIVIVGGLAGMMGTIGLIFVVAFIIMYALNLKHMS